MKSSPALYGDALAWRIGGDRALLVYIEHRNEDRAEVRTLIGAGRCPIDHFFPLSLQTSAAACVLVHCIREVCRSVFF